MSKVESTSETSAIPTKEDFQDKRPQKRRNFNDRKNHGNKNSKRPRFSNNKKEFNTSDDTKRHGKAEFSKQPIPKSVCIAPDEMHFVVFTSNTALNTLSNTVYNSMQSQINGFDRVMSLELFQYIIQLLWITRIATVASKAGRGYLRGVAELKKECEGIYVPHFLAKAIESFGSYELPTGIKIIPFIQQYSLMEKWGGKYFTKISVPHGFSQDDTPWPLSTMAIVKYNTAVSKAMCKNIALRVVDFDNIEGSSLMASCYQKIQSRRIVGRSCALLPESEVQLNAALCGRDDIVSDWPSEADNTQNYLCYPMSTTSVFSQEELLAAAFIRSLVQQ